MNRFKKVLHLLLLLTFVVTMLVPLTGLTIHKLASTLFLLLALLHTALYRKALGRRSCWLLGAVLAAFASGVLSLIFREVTLVLALHKVISFVMEFFLAIHIFLYHKKLMGVR